MNEPSEERISPTDSDLNAHFTAEDLKNELRERKAAKALKKQIEEKKALEARIAALTEKIEDIGGEMGGLEAEDEEEDVKKVD